MSQESWQTPSLPSIGYRVPNQSVVDGMAYGQRETCPRLRFRTAGGRARLSG
jgi:hypothetical protein